MTRAVPRRSVQARPARALAWLATAWLASPARAEPPAPPPAYPGPSSVSHFWQRMGALRQREIAEIVDHAWTLYREASRPAQDHADLQVRELLLNDARGMLRYGLGIAPGDALVLEPLALVEEASGNAERALALYQDLFERQHERTQLGSACTSYGLLEARLDHVERALEILAACAREEESRGTPRADTAVNLALLYATHGRMDDAIAWLERRRKLHSGNPIVAMVLIALYDKDGQINQALALYEELRVWHEYRLYESLAQSMEDLPVVPAEERHYLVALILELERFLPEAREEWHHYLRSGPRAVFSKRAREHMLDIEALLASPKKKRARSP